MLTQHTGGVTYQLVRADIVRLGIIGVRHTLIGVGPVAYRTSAGITVGLAYRLGQEIALAVRVLKRESDMVCTCIGALGIERQDGVIVL